MSRDAQVGCRAFMLITSTARELLVVHQRKARPTEWTLPGGRVADGESPSDGAVREVAEEIGLRVRAKQALVIDFAGDHLAFVFEGPVISQEPDIRLQADELDNWAWIPLRKADQLLKWRQADRVRRALRGSLSYQELAA